MAIDISRMDLATLKSIPQEDLPGLAAEIRQFLLDTISKTGGHIGANLGTVELTIALHYVFDSPHDKILFDTGHQGYAHRILTGRAPSFYTLNTHGGMSRFLDACESPHDILSASHAGTAISTAVGLAQAMRMAVDDHRVIAVVGDGTLGEGLAWEGLNYLVGTDLPVIIVINDNGMAIPKTVGGVAQMGAEDFFTSLGFHYMPCQQGHNIRALCNIFSLVSGIDDQGPIVVHVKTEKGHGLPCAATHPYRMHFSMPFDPITGAGASPTIQGRTYAHVAALTLRDALEEDPGVVILTPATPYASALDDLLLAYPDRVLDVGMAEQHAVSMAAGLALGGKKPVVCMQSTFLQRAYDQILHDVCYLNLPVTFLVVRSGFSGYDSPTHHGLWDIPVLRSFPNMQLYYPIDSMDMTDTLTRRLTAPQGPFVLLHPYEPIQQPEPCITERHDGYGIAQSGKDGTILCLGNTLTTALAVRDALLHSKREAWSVMCVAALKPFPLAEIASERIVTIEEGMLAGGFGSLIAEHMHDRGITIPMLRCGVNDHFVPVGSKQECSAECGMTAPQIAESIIVWESGR